MTVLLPEDSKKDFFEWRPFGIKKRYIYIALWILVTALTWHLTQDSKKTVMALVGTPLFTGFGFLFAGLGWAVLYLLYMFFSEMFPCRNKTRTISILISLWLAIPVCTLVVKQDVWYSLCLLGFIPLLAYGLLFITGAIVSCFGLATGIKNSVLRWLIYIVITLGVVIAVLDGVTSKERGDDGYEDQWNRGDPTYRMR